MTAADFPIPEGRLAEQLGLPRKALKVVRAAHLEEKCDWIYAASGAIHYSQAATRKAIGLLGIDAEKIVLAMPAAPEPAKEEPFEGCGEAATDHDVEGIPPCPACAGCIDAIPASESTADSAPNAPTGALTEDPAPPAVDLTEPQSVAITVTRCFTVNRRIVDGAIDGRQVRVRVRDSHKLRVGMCLICHHVEGDIYTQAERLRRASAHRAP